MNRALLVVALFVAFGSRADEVPPEARAAVPQLEQVAWLAGSWAGESRGTRQEELWLAPAGGLMLGLHRDVGASGKASFEYLRIEQHADGVIYQASPAGAPPTPFRLTEATAIRAVFSNPGHDFPKLRGSCPGHRRRSLGRRHAKRGGLRSRAPV